MKLLSSLSSFLYCYLLIFNSILINNITGVKVVIENGPVSQTLHLANDITKKSLGLAVKVTGGTLGIAESTVNTTLETAINPLAFKDNSERFQKSLRGDLNKVAEIFQELQPKSIPLPTSINLISVDEPYAKRMAYLAGTSYCNNSNIVSWNCTRCQQFPEARAFGIYLDEVTQGKAVLIIDERGKNIVLSFRGTSNIYNWFSNAQVLLTNLYFGNFKIKVHSGFKAMNEKLFKLYSNDLKELLKQYSDFNLIITGHSLGGAVSSLATIKIKEKLNIKDDRLINISYGSPRVGNHHFALKYNSMKHRVLRVTNKRDIVPHIPPRLLGYAHHQHEFWVETPPKLNKFCDQSVYEDPNCSLSMEPELSVQDHFVYWDIHISGTC